MKSLLMLYPEWRLTMNNTFSTSKIKTIISHEYITKVTSKGFIISTLIGPILMLLVIAVPVAITLLTGNSTEKKIAIIDRTDKGIGKNIVKADNIKYYLADKSEEELKKDVLSQELDGFLIIPENIVETSKATVFTRGGGGIGFIASLDDVVTKAVRKERLIRAGTDTSVIALVEKGVSIQTQKITKEGTEKDFTEAYAVLGYILGFMIYIMMFMYGSFVMRGVIEEKANRIVEVLASSARPFEIMFGKVVGIGAVGLTQVLFWIVIGAILMAVAGPIINSISPNTIATAQQVAMKGSQTPIPVGLEIPKIPLMLMVAFVFFFLIGYFIYSTLFAAVGSAVDQEQDAQQLMLPVTLPIVIPILFIGAVIANPDGNLAIILSLIPLFTPILMIVRIAATQVPIWQIALSIVLTIGTFFGCLWMASRIYRVGILMYGKKPNFKDIIKWIKMG